MDGDYQGCYSSTPASAYYAALELGPPSAPHAWTWLRFEAVSPADAAERLVAGMRADQPAGPVLVLVIPAREDPGITRWVVEPAVRWQAVPAGGATAADLRAHGAHGGEGDGL